MSFKNLQYSFSQLIQSDYFKQNNKNIVVLGAGKCNDLPLSILKNTFNEITLVDIMNFPPIEFAERITCDITGLSNKTFDAISSEDFFEKMINLIDVDYIPCELIHKEFSLVVSDLITTQIYLKYFDLSVEKFGTVNKSKLLEFINKLLEQHRNLCKKLCNDDGFIIHITDVFEVDKRDNGVFTPSNKVWQHNFKEKNWDDVLQMLSTNQWCSGPLKECVLYGGFPLFDYSKLRFCSKWHNLTDTKDRVYLCISDLYKKADI